MQEENWVLGVDGGGTKTVAWLADRQANVQAEPVGRGKAGPSNPSAVGFAAAMAAIDAAIAAAFRDAGIERSPVTAACFALAGADRQGEREQFTNWAQQTRVAPTVRVCNDAEPILACVADSHGVALIAGTGSFALGRDESGTVSKVGGWGFRLGDEGSGYAVATAGLTAAVRYADGRGEATSLLDRFTDHFQVQEVRNLISHIYAPDFDRRAVADLAPLVVAEADAGDRTAQRVLEDAATSLARMVQAASSRLTLPLPLPLAITGGFILNTDCVRAQMVEKLAESGVAAEVTLVPEAVRGAVVLAREAAHHS